ncbi:cathelicidin antimicrobial peptide-like [Lissotriton helveticus]
MWLQVALVLGLVAGANPASYENGEQVDLGSAIAAAVNSYNSHHNTSSVFRIKNYWIQGLDANTSNSVAQLTFTIQETVCQESEDKKPEECDFKDGGIVKNCTTVIRKGNNTADLLCDPANSESLPLKTSIQISVNGYKDGKGEDFIAELNKLIETSFNTTSTALMPAKMAIAWLICNVTETCNNSE